MRTAAPASRAWAPLTTIPHSSPVASWGAQADSCFTLLNSQFGQSLGGNGKNQVKGPLNIIFKLPEFKILICLSSYVHLSTSTLQPTLNTPFTFLPTPSLCFFQTPNILFLTLRIRWGKLGRSVYTAPSPLPSPLILLQNSDRTFGAHFSDNLT